MQSGLKSVCFFAWSNILLHVQSTALHKGRIHTEGKRLAANPLALWEGILSVWAHLWAVSPPYLSSPFSLFPAEFSSLAQKIYQRTICRHLSVWDTRKRVHTNVEKHNHAHAHTAPTEGQTPIPIPPVTLHSIAAKAELQNWGQTSSACCYEFSAFLDQCIRAFSQAASKRTHKRICAHRCEDTHVGNTCKAAVSQSTMSLFRYSEQTASLRNFKLVLLSRLLTAASGAELKTTLEHMSYWSDQSQQSCRHTITSYLSHSGDGWSRKEDWDGACHLYIRTPTSEERGAIYICLCFYKEVGTLVKLISLLSLFTGFIGG